MRTLNMLGIAAALLAGALDLHAQAWVEFSNAPWENWFDPYVDRRVYYSQCGVDPIDDSRWSAALFQLRSGQYVQLGAPANFFGPSVPGVWMDDYVSRSLTVPPGLTTTLQVRIYDGAGNLMGSSADFPYAMGVSDPPDPSDTLMHNFHAFCVPEPCSFALAALGFGVWLVFHRATSERPLGSKGHWGQASTFNNSSGVFTRLTQPFLPRQTAGETKLHGCISPKVEVRCRRKPIPGGRVPLRGGPWIRQKLSRALARGASRQTDFLRASASNCERLYSL